MPFWVDWEMVCCEKTLLGDSATGEWAVLASIGVCILLTCLLVTKIKKMSNNKAQNYNRKFPLIYPKQ